MVKVKRKTGSATLQGNRKIEIETVAPEEQSQVANCSTKMLSKKAKSMKANVGTPKEALVGELSKMMMELAKEAVATGMPWATAEAKKEIACENRKNNKRKFDVIAKEAAKIQDAFEEERGVVEETPPMAPSSKNATPHSKQANTYIEKHHAKNKAKRFVQENGKVQRTGKNTATLSPTRKHRDERKIFLGGLPWSVDEQTVRKDFGKFGEIEKCHFCRDEKGKPRGQAYIYYHSKDVVNKVLCLDGIAYKGRAIKVKRRSPRRRSGVKTRRQRSRREKCKDGIVF